MTNCNQSSCVGVIGWAENFDPIYPGGIMNSKAWTMRGIFGPAILAALLATPCWAQFTPPASPADCPCPAWKLPPAQPGDAIVFTDPHGVQYTKAQMDSLYDQVCWQQDPPDTGARGNQLRTEFLERFGPPHRYAY